MPRLVVFDCDGTLVDSQHAIVEAVKSAFDLHRLRVPADEAIRRIVGLSVPEAMTRLLEPHAKDRVATVADAFKSAFMDIRARSHHGFEPLFPGIREALTALGEAGYLLAVATGKSRRGLEATLAHHGLAHHFVSLQTADAHPSKPHPAMLEAAMADCGTKPGDTLLVGDTSYDMIMAGSAGARSLGVAWGYHPAAELLEAGAAAVAPDGMSLPALIAGLYECETHDRTS